MKDFVTQPEATRAYATSPTYAKVQTTPAMPQTPATNTPPAPGDISRRAYDLYLKSGRKQGRCVQNWLQAEQELKQEGCTNKSTSPPPAPNQRLTGSKQ